MMLAWAELDFKLHDKVKSLPLLKFISQHLYIVITPVDILGRYMTVIVYNVPINQYIVIKPLSYLTINSLRIHMQKPV